MGEPIIYEITIQEQLGEQWGEWFAPLVIHNSPGGFTTLTGVTHDEAELYGLLEKVRDLNLTLIAVKRIQSTEAPNSLS